ncbi:GNAT family N-acetyltransferase [Shouchella sp. 1P09AA]|uniref:GNAT family N-acetyltransferase n=1 Tax=unclassified Shouchella TaxID=2893065 RepID=UPI0039A03A2E
MNIRLLRESDFEFINGSINEWWGGRQMQGLLPRLFFTHFSNTSYVVEENNELVGFLVGFQSPAQPERGYIHFVGIAPDARRSGIGSFLYKAFFEKMISLKVREVYGITSPVNKKSIAYHQQMGFSIVKGTKEIDGVSIHENYDGAGVDRVVFKKDLLE